jgi:tRNA(fMet)-specific endonuclease VapC
MLDTCICSFIIRKHPASVIQRLTAEVEQGRRIVACAMTYAEMRYGQIGI